MEKNKTETVAIHITKAFLGSSPSHWEVEVRDHNGDMMGLGTAPTFAQAHGLAYEFVTGDSNEFDAQHNGWVDFDANNPN